MTILVIILSVILLVLAAIHMLWGFGYWFPIRDETELVKAVVGAKGADRMPGAIPCGLVAAGLIIIIFALWSHNGWLRQFVLIIAAGVFMLRGIATYTKPWRRMTPIQPFARLDRLYYGPLCLGLGAMILLVAI